MKHGSNQRFHNSAKSSVQKHTEASPIFAKSLLHYGGLHPKTLRVASHVRPLGASAPPCHVPHVMALSQA